MTLSNAEIIEYLQEFEDITTRLAGKKFAVYPDTRYNTELIRMNYYLGKIRRHLADKD